MRVLVEKEGRRFKAFIVALDTAYEPLDALRWGI